MTKKILVTLIAALMLFAFTACDQPATPKVVINATIRQTGVFLEGQAFDSSKFVVDVTYSDSSTDTISGANMVTPVDDVFGGVKNGMDVKATIGAGQSSAVSYTGVLTAYPVDSFTVTQNATYYKDTTAADMTNADFTVVANYTANGTAATYTLQPSEYTVNASTIVSALSGATVSETVLTDDVAVTNAISALGKQISTDVTVSYKPTTGDKIVDIEVVVKTDSAAKAAAIQRGAFTPATMLTVYPVYDNGYEPETPTALQFGDQTGYELTATLATPLEIKNPSSSETSGSIVRFGALSENAVNVTIEVEDADTKEVTTITKQVKIATRADYVTAMSAEKADDVESWKPNAPISYNQFDITATSWASGYQNAVEDYSTTPDSVPSANIKFDKANAPAEGTFSVVVSYVTTPAYSDSAADVTVSSLSVVE